MDMDITCITTDNNWYYLVASLEWESMIIIISLLVNQVFFFQCTKLPLVKTTREKVDCINDQRSKKRLVCMMHHSIFDGNENLFFHEMVRTDRTNQSKDKPIVVCGLWLTKLPSACSIYTTTHALNNTTTPSDIANPTSEKWGKKEKPLHVSEASNERRDRKRLGWVGWWGLT